MIKTAAAATVVAMVAAFALLVPSSAHARPLAAPPACAHPAVVRDGLIEVRCFPRIPAKQFPTSWTMSKKCSHIDAWTTGHSTETVNGQRYKITQKVRDDVWICKS